MKESLNKYFKASENLEKTISDLYKLYAEYFQEDSDFWYKLSDEELTHSFIWKNGREDLLSKNLFPKILMKANIKEIKKMTDKIKSIIKDFNKFCSDKIGCLEFALEIENGAIENDFQKACEEVNNDKATRIFKAMVNDEKNHAKRIEELIIKYK